MDVEEFFGEGAGDGGAGEEVCEAGGDGGEAGGFVDVAEGVGVEGAEAAGVVVGKELGLVGGHVYVGGALGFAGLAGEAEVEGLVDLLVAEAVFEDVALEHLPEEVGAAAGGVLLFAGGHVAGAHGAGLFLAAGADADAARGGVGEGAVVAEEGEVGGWAARAGWAGVTAEVVLGLVDGCGGSAVGLGICADELAGVHACWWGPREL